MKRLIYGLAALTFCAPLLANAAEGFVVADISLQAGPDTEYPSITELAAGTPVTIAGCIDGWTWCDVIAVGERGWVPGTFLEEEYGGQRVVIIDYGARIGIPVVSFSIGAYWDRYYHSRPFYAQRQEFEARAIHPHAPPRPSGVAATRSGTQRSGTATVAAPAQSTSERNAQTTQQRERAAATTQQQQQRERATAQQTQERAAAQQQTRERTAQQQRATTNERVPQTAQRTDETRPQQQHATEQQRAQAEQRMAQTPRHEETPANKPSETPPPRNPEDRSQNPRGAVTAKAQTQKKPEPKTKDELNKPKKDDKDNGGGQER